MTSTIITKNSSTASSVPSAGSLTQGELAVNVTDKKLYTKDSGGTVVKLVGSLGNQEANAAAITGGSINGTTVGASTASTGAFTTLSASSTVSGTGFSTYLASPPAIGGTAAAAGSFTTLSASGAVTLSGGTANGVAYLNGSKVVTSGSALTFDGTSFSVGETSAGKNIKLFSSSTGNNGLLRLYDTGNTERFQLGVSTTLVSNYAPASTSHVWFIDSEQMRLTSTGLGIGTSSPAAKLDVTGTFNGTQAVFGNTSGRGLLIGTALNGGVNEGSSVLNARGAGNGQFLFQTDGTTRMTLSDSGNLGLGTTSPTAFGSGYTTLTISGSNAGIFQSKNTSGDTRLYANTDGDAYLGSWANTSLRMYTNSTLKATLDASGNLGLGVTPSAWNSGFKALQVNGASLFADASTFSAFITNAYYNSSGQYIYKSTDYATSYRQYLGTHAWFTAPSGTAGNAITFTQAMTLTAGGDLYVGATTGSYRVTAGRNAGGTQIAVTTATSNGSNASPLFMDVDFLGYADSTRARIRATDVSANSGDSFLSFWTNGSGGFLERGQFTANGNFLVGTTGSINTTLVSIYAPSSSNVLGLRNSNDANYLVTALNTAGTEVFRVAGSGNVLNTNNSYGALSDAKLKENIIDATPKLAGLMQVKVRNYNLIGETTKQIGVVAQELETVFPAMVDESPDKDAEGNDLGTTTKSVKYSVFVPMLIKALQEQQAIIESLKARLDAANL